MSSGSSRPLTHKVARTHVYDPYLGAEVPIVTVARPKVPAVRAKQMPKPKAKPEETHEEKMARLKRAWKQRP